MMMQTVRAPLSRRVSIDELRPSQITVGFREVKTRADRLKAQADGDADKFLRKHIIPVVKGPGNALYVIDHHHLCRALLLAGGDEVLVTVISNLTRLEDEYAFWVFLDNKGLVHPFDAEGKRRDYADIPKSIQTMTDDPFRSLAGALRRKGGYAKDTTPFSEFLWADFLRRRFIADDAANKFDATLAAALALAKKPEADHLPGWCGPLEEEG